MSKAYDIKRPKTHHYFVNMTFLVNFCVLPILAQREPVLFRFDHHCLYQIMIGNRIAYRNWLREIHLKFSCSLVSAFCLIPFIFTPRINVSHFWFVCMCDSLRFVSFYSLYLVTQFVSSRSKSQCPNTYIYTHRQTGEIVIFLLFSFPSF